MDAVQRHRFVPSRVSGPRLDTRPRPPSLVLRGALRHAARAHSGRAEIGALALLYGIYELVRGVRHVAYSSAVGNADEIVDIERRLHVFAEAAVQRMTDGVAFLPDALALLYPVLHFTVSIGVLVWVYRKRRHDFAFVRTALVAMTSLALIGFVVFPVAPPRLAVSGFVDTVSRYSPLDLGSSILGRFYNPVAAVPSLHFAYALLFAGAILVLARRTAIRVAAAAYPPLVLLVITATGNHFFFDAATGAVVAALGVGIAVVVARSANAPS